LKITFLCENSVQGGRGLLGEHGLSILVESEGRTLLFDTGQGLGLTSNARALGVDLSEIDEVVLSHGHYDHTGGLQALLEGAEGLRITAHPEVFSPKYSNRGGRPHYIGIPFSKEALEGWGAELRLVREPVEVIPGVFTTGEVPGERMDRDLLVKTPQGFDPDPLRDDLSLFAETPEGIVLILGCAHAGVVHIMEHVQGMVGRRPFALVVGGTHLGPLPGDRRREAIEGLKAFEIRAMGVAHCTGLENLPLLEEELEATVFPSFVGMRIEV